ncbi:30S ribosomal protein S4 [Oxyplasma meridianum]|uniref:Small ribosomal subunit protein uS4 n=1 Tax=Oxyplasma meridianum TaxID=3073602 RepID=A0AAX4NDX4_9ARCH
MGDPKFPKKKYATPRHPWEKERIDSEKEIVVKYGLKNKRELWKSQAMLESVRSQARKLQAKLRTEDQFSQKQFQDLIKRLSRYSILGENASLDDVLSLSIDDILQRRLQTIVFRKNLARTPKQARQIITHGHVEFDGRRVNVPGIMVEGSKEESIRYSERSALNDDLHPIRQVLLNGSQVQHRESIQEEAKAVNGENRR